VAPGLILLLLLGGICAFFITRSRRRLGMPVTGKTWITAIVGFIVVILVIWVASSK
jgi:hypothetical protein